MTTADIILNSELSCRYDEYAVNAYGAFVTEFDTYVTEHIIAENLVIVSRNHGGFDGQEIRFIHDILLFSENGVWHEISTSRRRHRMMDELNDGSAYSDIAGCVGGYRFADMIRGLVEAYNAQ